MGEVHVWTNFDISEFSVLLDLTRDIVGFKKGQNIIKFDYF